MRHVVKSLLAEWRLAYCFGRKVLSGTQLLRQWLKLPLTALFTLVMPAILTGYFIVIIAAPEWSASSLLSTIAHVSSFFLLTQIASLQRQCGDGNVINVFTVFYVADSAYAGRSAMASSARLALVCGFEAMIFIIVYSIYHGISGSWIILLLSGITAYLLVSASAFCLALLACKHLGRLWWGLIATAYFIYLTVGTVGYMTHMLPSGFVLNSGSVIAQWLPQALVYSAFVELQNGTLTWLTAVKCLPAAGLLALIPFAVRRFVSDYSLAETMVELGQSDLEHEEFKDWIDESVEEDGIHLLETIGTPKDAVRVSATGNSLSRRMGSCFSPTEWFLHDYLFAQPYALIGPWKWSLGCLILLLSYRVTVSSGWVGLSGLFVGSVFVAAALPWLACAARSVPAAQTMGGALVPFENGLPIHPEAIRRLSLKQSYLRMITGLPFILALLFAVPFEWFTQVEGARLSLLRIWVAWFCLLPVCSMLLSQNGYVSSGRRRARLVGAVNLMLLLLALGLFIATLCAAWFSWLNTLYVIATTWLVGLGANACFAYWKRKGFFEMRIVATKQ